VSGPFEIGSRDVDSLINSDDSPKRNFQDFPPLIIDHIHNVGWPDHLAPQEEWLYQDLDWILL
jgi:hypothetical protein